ncbi:Myc-type [Macleaya cordata]|uniref:Myc-type n=1 Tax=Macleaya cordata TaxID=56857 RepID=A0A200QY04_MACCD|nr:Myc-type [Macleaya cordata]
MRFGGSGYGRRGRGSRMEDGTMEFKSKNLEAERKRREKLNQRLMDLRSVVPIITNMTKAAIIEDAITYIEGLQQQVKGLSDRLHEMETVLPEEGEDVRSEDDTDQQETEKYSIESEVKVAHLEGNKLWIKIICDGKRGGFTKLMEIMSSLGFETIDTNFTSFKGVTLTTLCVKGRNVEVVEMEQLKEFLLEMVGGV